MAAHDLVIRNSVVVDGTGPPRRRADVAIDGGTFGLHAYSELQSIIYPG